MGDPPEEKKRDGPYDYRDDHHGNHEPQDAAPRCSHFRPTH